MLDTKGENTEETTADAELRARFQRDRDEYAFALLVHRHYPLITGIARRILLRTDAADDVAQATFFVLARSAKTIRKPSAVGSWLFGVAYRMSARLAKQQAKEQALVGELTVDDDPLEKICARFEQNAVVEELHRLPESLREPMVLRYLEENSNAEVADKLKLSESAVEGRLKRGRKLLRMHLARKGVTFGAAIAILQDLRADELPNCHQGLVDDFVRAITQARDAPRGGIETRHQVSRLVKEEMMSTTAGNMTKWLAVCCLSVGTVAVGWSLFGTGFRVRASETGATESDATVVEEASSLFDASADAIRIAKPNSTQPQFIGGADEVEGEGKSSDSRTPKQMQPKRFDVKPRSAAKERILAAMGNPVRIEFSDTPLTEVIEYLEEFSDIQIEVDNRSLDQQGIDPSSETVTKYVTGISLRSALHLILRDLSLAWVIQDEVLLILSAEEAETLQDTRVYAVNANWQMDAEKLVEIIQGSTAPESWKASGGAGFVVAYEGGLVIRQSQQVHEEINDLLNQIDWQMALTQSAGPH